MFNSGLSVCAFVVASLTALAVGVVLAVENASVVIVEDSSSSPPSTEFDVGSIVVIGSKVIFVVVVTFLNFIQWQQSSLPDRPPHTPFTCTVYNMDVDAITVKQVILVVSVIWLITRTNNLQLCH